MIIDPESSKEIVNEAKALAPEVYKDVAKPALQEVGSVAGRTVKAFLAPLRGLLWGWERIEDFVETEVKKRLDKIPEEKRKSPEPEIAVPLLQALTYTAQNETLREMYVNLLANAMNVDKNNVVHPSFVEIIKQMNSLDAKVFDELAKINAYQKILNPRITIKGQGKFFTGATPEWYAGWTIEGYSEFDVSASLVRLSKFGLIELMFDRTAGKDGYDSIRSTPFLRSILNKYQTGNADLELEIGGTESIVYVNEYGIQFKNACK
ncbi:DUF4393 domain-containing protein [Pedobacter deserti]|uniref:DUF4393 domain-containing protein n=1 Tax=Pedobacter deserti TaxID=2817382 RepID=UPI00210A0D07|nr:DUF4393 domain-containing protein [Pedobacter sp. SYSU D00382]